MGRTLGSVLVFALVASCSDSSQASSNSVLDAGLELISTNVCPPLDAGCLAVPGPSFSTQVLPIINKSCASAAGCHTGMSGDPWPLNHWDDVAEWSNSVMIDLNDCSMPPLDSGVPLTVQDRATVSQWIACGAKND